MVGKQYKTMKGKQNKIFNNMDRKYWQFLALGNILLWPLSVPFLDMLGN